MSTQLPYLSPISSWTPGPRSNSYCEASARRLWHLWRPRKDHPPTPPPKQSHRQLISFGSFNPATRARPCEANIRCVKRTKRSTSPERCRQSVASDWACAGPRLAACDTESALHRQRGRRCRKWVGSKDAEAVVCLVDSDFGLARGPKRLRLSRGAAGHGMGQGSETRWLDVDCRIGDK